MGKVVYLHVKKCFHLCRVCLYTILLLCYKKEILDNCEVITIKKIPHGILSLC